MRGLLRTTACIAVLAPFALLVAGSAIAVTITSASGEGNPGRAVATAVDDPYCTGTMFTINGTGFVSDGGVLSVSIGNVPANQFSVGSDTKMYAQVGKGATNGPIVVTTKAGTFSTDQLPGGRFTAGDDPDSLQGGVVVLPCYSDPKIVKPAVSYIKPNPVKGGKKTQITGTGFAGVTKVTVGGKPVTFAVATDTNIILIVPRSAPNGKLTVVLTNSAGATVTSTVKLTKKA